MRRRSALPSGSLFYGWFVLAACFFTLFFNMGIRVGFGAFVIPMETDLGVSRTAISMAIALGWLVMGISQPYLGRLNDLIGGRKVIVSSIVVLGATTLLLGGTTNIWFLAIVYGVIGSVAASGSSAVIAHSVLARWFIRKRGAVAGISAAGASAGAMLLVPFLTYLIILSSWRVAWVVLGVLVLLIALPLALLFLKDDPAEMGLSPDGDPGPTSSDAGPESNAPRPRGRLEVLKWREAFKSAPVWELMGGYFVCGMTTAVMAAHQIPFLVEEKGASSSVAALSFALMMGINLVSVLSIGALSDRLGRKNPLGVVYAMRAIAYLVLLTAPGAFGIWGFAIIGGVSWLATIPLTSSLTGEIYGIKNMGVLFGLITMVHSLGSALSIYLSGVVRDATGSYMLPFAVVGAMLVAASLASFAIRERRYSSKYPVASSPASAAGVAD